MGILKMCLWTQHFDVHHVQSIENYIDLMQIPYQYKCTCSILKCIRNVQVTDTYNMYVLPLQLRYGSNTLFSQTAKKI
jgi:hypothetical protein